MIVPMPSPRGTNYANLFINNAAYDSVHGLVCDAPPTAIAPKEYYLMNDPVKYAVNYTRLKLALDMDAADLDAQSAMDTMKRAASRMSRQEWDSAYDVCGGRDSVMYHGQKVPDGGMQARGGNNAMAPGNMPPRGGYESSSHVISEDVKKNFAEMYGAPVRNLGNYGVQEPSRAPMPSGADTASFHEMYK